MLLTLLTLYYKSDKVTSPGKQSDLVRVTSDSVGEPGVYDPFL